MEFPRLVLLNGASARTAPVARPIFGGRGSSNPVPWVTLVTGCENKQFVVGGDLSMLEQAKENTLKLPYKWSVAGTRGMLWFKRPSLLRAYGDFANAIVLLGNEGADDLSTEVLLNPEAMRQAETMLRAKSLAVVAPKRGWLLVTAAKPGEIPKTTPLFQAGKGLARPNSPYTLCGNAVIFTKNGVPMGIEVRDGNSGYVSLSPSDGESWDNS